jgi:hypothetical protein
MRRFLGESGINRERVASRKVRIIAINVRALRIVPINHGGITSLISAAQ